MSFGLFVIVFAPLLVIALITLYRRLSITVDWRITESENDRETRRPDAKTARDRLCFREDYQRDVIDLRYASAKERLSVSKSLQFFREQKNLLEASMRDVETLLCSKYKGFDIVTGLLVAAAQREANLEQNEANFLRAHYFLHGDIARVQTSVKDLRVIMTNLRTWMSSGVSDRVLLDAHALIIEVEAECDSVCMWMLEVIREADGEPVGIRVPVDVEGEPLFGVAEDYIPSSILTWRKERAEARSKLRAQ